MMIMGKATYVEVTEDRMPSVRRFRPLPDSKERLVRKADVIYLVKYTYQDETYNWANTVTDNNIE